MSRRTDGLSEARARVSRFAVGLGAAGAVVLGGLIASSAAQAQKAHASSSVPTFAQACGTKSVTLTGEFETGFPDVIDLTKAFSKQYPSVHWKITTEAFANLTTNVPLVLASKNAPDLVRLPLLEGLVKDHLLLNLDPYYKEYDWASFPSSDWAQNRTNGSELGVGDIYAWGLNQQVTGLYYNKALAKQIGLTSPPTTLAQLEGYFAKAKAAGLTPIEVWGASPSTGLTFPLQQLMADYSSVTSINNWAFDKRGANIDTAGDVQAANVLASWIKAGYFNSDATSLSYSGAQSEWTASDSKDVFMFNGNWQASTTPDQFGFFAMPPVKAGGAVASIGGPLQYGIARQAPNPSCTAFFLNWVSTNPTARKINVAEGGSPPIGPAKLASPKAAPGSTAEQAIAAENVVAKDNSDMGFITNANGSIYAESETPQLQSLFAGQTTPSAVMSSIQSAFVADGS